MPNPPGGTFGMFLLGLILIVAGAGLMIPSLAPYVMSPPMGLAMALDGGLIWFGK